MTLSEYEKLTPREKDALVAEKVMGWTDLFNIGDFDSGGTPPSWVNSGVRYHQIPKYTSSIFAALEVVDSLQEKSPFSMNGNYPFVMRGLFHCSRNSDPESICIGALRALGIIKE